MRKWVTIGDYEGEAVVDDTKRSEVVGSSKDRPRIENLATESESHCRPPEGGADQNNVPNDKSVEGEEQSVTDSSIDTDNNSKSETCTSEDVGDNELNPGDNKTLPLTLPKETSNQGKEETPQKGDQVKSDVKKTRGKWQALGAKTKKGKDKCGSDTNSSGGGSVKSSKSGEGNCDEEEGEPAMDAELPTPEHITSFYDLVKAVKNSNENLSAQEIENKFKQLSLAFKTDRLTLRQRLDIQQRLRDIAEANFEKELELLRNSILSLHEDCIDMELVDAVMQVRKHMDILTTSSSSLLSASEVWGAVQQEWRVSRALEVLLLHVENVKRLYEHDHQELEEMRRLLTEHQIELPSSQGSGSSNQSSSTDALGSRRIRALSLAGLNKQQSQETGNRRISLGPGASKTVLNNFLGARSSRRRASLMPDLRPFRQELSAVAAAAIAAQANSASSQDTEDKTNTTNGMLNSSITEEGSESGDDGADAARSEGSDDAPPISPIRRLTHFPLYGQHLQDSDQRSYEDYGSPVHPDAESLLLNSHTSNVRKEPDSWMMHTLEELVGLLRERQWPYTLQQTLQGALTSFIVMLALFYFFVATCSAGELPEPCNPGWTFSVKRHGNPPI